MISFMPSEDLGSLLLELQKEGEFCNVELNAGGVCAAIHSCVLAARCPALAATLVQSGHITPYTIHLCHQDDDEAPACPLTTLHKLVAFIYCQPVQLREEDRPHFLNFARVLGLLQLIEKLQELEVDAALVDNDAIVDSVTDIADMDCSRDCDASAVSNTTHCADAACDGDGDINVNGIVVKELTKLDTQNPNYCFSTEEKQNLSNCVNKTVDNDDLMGKHTNDDGSADLQDTVNFSITTSYLEPRNENGELLGSDRPPSSFESKCNTNAAENVGSCIATPGSDFIEAITVKCNEDFSEANTKGFYLQENSLISIRDVDCLIELTIKDEMNTYELDQNCDTISGIINQTSNVITCVDQLQQKSSCLELSMKPSLGDYSVPQYAVDCSSNYTPKNLSGDDAAITDEAGIQNGCVLITDAIMDSKDVDSMTASGRLYCGCCHTYFRKCPDLVKHIISLQHYSSTCPICSFQASDGFSQRRHFSLHDFPLPFFCCGCDLRFRTRAQLAMHVPKHSSSKPYSCGDCGRAFKWRHALQAHVQRHRSVGHLLCDMCGFSSSYITTFKAHLKQHTGQAFTCPHVDCSFKAFRKDNLKSHIASHSNVRPHQCDVCGNSFSLARNLSRHMRLHSSTRLKCSDVSKATCGFATTRPDKLRSHLDKKHSMFADGTTKFISDGDDNDDEILAQRMLDDKRVAKLEEILKTARVAQQQHLTGSTHGRINLTENLNIVDQGKKSSVSTSSEINEYKFIKPVERRKRKANLKPSNETMKVITDINFTIEPNRRKFSPLRKRNVKRRCHIANTSNISKSPVVKCDETALRGSSKVKISRKMSLLAKKTNKKTKPSSSIVKASSGSHVPNLLFPSTALPAVPVSLSSQPTYTYVFTNGAIACTGQNLSATPLVSTTADASTTNPVSVAPSDLLPAMGGYISLLNILPVASTHAATLSDNATSLSITHSSSSAVFPSQSEILSSADHSSEVISANVFNPSIIVKTEPVPPITSVKTVAIHVIDDKQISSDTEQGAENTLLYEETSGSESLKLSNSCQRQIIIEEFQHQTKSRDDSINVFNNSSTSTAYESVDNTTNNREQKGTVNVFDLHNYDSSNTLKENSDCNTGKYYAVSGLDCSQLHTPPGPSPEPPHSPGSSSSALAFLESITSMTDSKRSAGRSLFHTLTPSNSHVEYHLTHDKTDDASASCITTSCISGSVDATGVSALSLFTLADVTLHSSSEEDLHLMQLHEEAANILPQNSKGELCVLEPGVDLLIEKNTKIVNDILSGKNEDNEQIEHIIHENDDNKYCSGQSVERSINRKKVKEDTSILEPSIENSNHDDQSSQQSQSANINTLGAMLETMDSTIVSRTDGVVEVDVLNTEPSLGFDIRSKETTAPNEDDGDEQCSLTLDASALDSLVSSWTSIE